MPKHVIGRSLDFQGTSLSARGDDLYLYLVSESIAAALQRRPQNPDTTCVGVIFLLGNGLSMGFDPRLASDAISGRVEEAIGPEVTAVLEQVSELARPDSVDEPIGASRGGFEQIAGPLDRLAEALIAVEDLVAATGGADAVKGIKEASAVLRHTYFSVVGHVLREVDACCHRGLGSGDRTLAWQGLNKFAAELVEWNRDVHVTVFTLNYDSLLMSAMLETGAMMYDGFPRGELDQPLDRWPHRAALYHLHGSVAWVRSEGRVTKRDLDSMRGDGTLNRWVGGDTTSGQPSVLLGDLKTPITNRLPFATFYDELRRCLAMDDLVVAGGYSFGDRPINHALAKYLSEGRRRRLIVWSPTPDRQAYLNRLRIQLPTSSRDFRDTQVTTESVTLPDAEAIADLRRDLPLRRAG